MSNLKTRKEETRQRIVETASRLFQQKGVDGVGVDEIMRESGLTHGGFYAHFANKEALVAEACTCALQQASAKWSGLGQLLSDDARFEQFMNEYLAGDPRTGAPACPAAMLGPDVARRGEAVQAAYTAGVKRMIEVIAKEAGAEREEAIAMFAAMIGATNLAASVGDDKALAAEILQATRRQLLQCGVAEG
ncbi:TetR/AcrR family transcriptional regulator [Caulobacter sp. 17J80-11]|uniref:TetR/AcrR family transcriptional regulator n=1 Tax=Caulobacter sp. 17J80-11 TaxID=2763502 RepID=UPI001CA3EBB2